MGEVDDTISIRGDDTPADTRPSAHLSDEIPPGTSFGRYVVIKRLGFGGMGVVYLAFDGSLDRRVALKLLRTDAGMDAEATARLLREAQVMARLAHPNVVAIFDVGTLDTRMFIAMEYIRGANLRVWRAERARSPGEIVAMFAAVGHGLAAAHAQSILHRDFKPENVLVDENGRPRVLDFGLARAEASVEDLPLELVDTVLNLKATTSAPLTQHGAILGTPAYMAPEQLRGGPIDARADQFAFCVTLYEALYGQRPFAGGTIRELRAAIEEGQIRPQPRSNRTPRPVFGVVARGLRAKPDERWPDVRALLSAVEHASGAAARKLRLVVGAAALLALFALVGVLVLRRGRPDPCKGAEHALVGIWDAPAREDIARAFRASGNTNAEASLERVTRAFDEYAGGWTAASTEACEATRVRGVQSDEALDLRTECLRERLENARAVTSLLRSADSALVDNALGSVRKLPAIRDCENVKALRAAFLPVPPEAAAAVESIRRDLAAVESRYNAGRCEGAEGVAKSVAERARAAGYAPIEAQALYWQGQVLHVCVSPKQASDTLVHANALAIETHQDDLAARCMIKLVGYLVQLGRFPEAEVYVALADAVVRRIGRPDALVSGLALARQAVAYARGNLELAEQLAREALEAHVRATGGGDPETLDEESSLTDLSYETGALRETLDAQRKLVGRATEVLGPAHFRTARFTLDVAETLLVQGRYEEAAPWLARALPTLSVAQREQAAFDDALLDLGRGDPSSGLAKLEKLVRIQEQAHGVDDVWPLSTRADLAKWLVVHRRSRAALDVAEPLIRRLETLGQRDTSWYANAYAASALAHARARGSEDALAAAEHAASVAEHAAAQLPFALLAVGEARLALGRRDDAVAPLERALKLANDRGGIDAIVLGDLDAALARAVALLDPGRARSLRQDASAAYRASREPAFADAPELREAVTGGAQPVH